MSIDLKIKTLRRLANTAGTKPLEVLEQECASVEAVLSSETQYDVLEEHLKLLSAFAFRVSPRSVQTVVSFIHRLKTLEISYAEDGLIPTTQVTQYQNPESLTLDAIEILIGLRYLEQETIFNELLKLLLHESDEIRKKASEGISYLAEYNLSVFYGTAQQEGIGAAPQKNIIDRIERFDDEMVIKHFRTLNDICENLLSPTLTGTSWGAEVVTFNNAAVPAIDDVKDIRRRSIVFLKRLYRLAKSVREKLVVIASLGTATRTHHLSDYGDDVKEMIIENTVEVLEFYQEVIATDDLPVIQKIEHDSYWQFYRSLREEVDGACLAIKKAIAQNAEYEIYKTLIGFEGIFGEWEKLKKNHGTYRQNDEIRKQKALEYARSVTGENFEEWHDRILRYAQVESDDLATFPIFYQFLMGFADAKPKLALDLISKDTVRIQGFLVPLLRALWAGDEKDAVRAQIIKWISQDQYLIQCTKMFMENEDLDSELLGSAREKAIEVGDVEAINVMVSVATSNYHQKKSFLLSEFFLPGIAALTALSNSDWVSDFWFRSQGRDLIRDLDEGGIDLVLENLSLLIDVDYHAEEILCVIAERYPTKIVEYFGQRLANEDRADKESLSRYDAVPYEFHKLAEPLSKIPDDAVRIVRVWYDGNYGMFIFRGAKLLKNIFPDFPAPFKTELSKLVAIGGEDDVKFVLAVLRNFEGQPYIHDVCKEIIKTLPEDSTLLKEVHVALISTGVVRGNFGFAEAYERKAKEVEGWLTDADGKIQSFAQRYIDSLKEMSAAERRTAEEEIALRKHEYGE